MEKSLGEQFPENEKVCDIIEYLPNMISIYSAARNGVIEVYFVKLMFQIIFGKIPAEDLRYEIWHLTLRHSISSSALPHVLGLKINIIIRA